MKCYQNTSNIYFDVNCLNQILGSCIQLCFLEPMCQYSGHLHETVYSKICISHDGRYLFSGCMTHGGVIWLLNLPYIEQPVLCTKYSMLNFKRELSCSDWCADSNSLKVSNLL